MARIFIDTGELHDIARDFRSYGGRLAPIKEPLARGMGSTVLAPPWGWRARGGYWRLSYELKLLGAKLWSDAASLEVEAFRIETTEAVASLWQRWALLLPQWSDSLRSLLGGRRFLWQTVRLLGNPFAPWAFRPIDVHELRVERGHSFSHPADYLRLIGDIEAQFRRGSLVPGTVAIIELAPNRWGVVLPGIQSLLPTSSPQDLPDAVLASLLGWSAYAEGVMKAMETAGVPGGAEIMLVGHSHGGITAVNLAANSAFQRRYNVKAVLSAGAPVTMDLNRVPPSTSALSITNRDDLVPFLDELFGESPVIGHIAHGDGPHQEVSFTDGGFSGPGAEHKCTTYADFVSTHPELDSDGSFAAFNSGSSAAHFVGIGD